MKRSTNISFWFFITISVLLVVFSVQNSGSVSVKLLFSDIDISLAILLVLTFLGGLVAGALYAFVRIRHKEEKKTNNIKDQSPKKNDN